MTISIQSQDYAMVLQTDNLNRLFHVYFGEKLANEKEYEAIGQQLRYHLNLEEFFHHAYTPSGTWNVVEPALQITHADGNPSTELKYISHDTDIIEQNIHFTRINLIDPLYHTEVSLCYKVYQKENVFEQWTVIKNGETAAITLDKYASANFYFTNQEFYLTQYTGSWAREMQPSTERLQAGIKTLDTKLGTRAHMYAQPSFMLSFDQVATEETGKVLLANLAWSGNFRFDFEKDRYHNLRLIAGANSHAAAYQLATGEGFETPHLIYTYSENGKGEASRNMHNWARKYRIYDGKGERLTLLNNWEATFFDFDEQRIIDLFDGAVTLGVDLFLLDDGWFANKYPRDDDTTGLGDWQEDKKKLPNGLGKLVKEAENKDIKFGIWIEPEMVNPKSELYENHTDWVIRQPNRQEFYYRNQLVLDLCNPAVQDHVFGVFDTIFTQNPSMAYVKWDCNSMIYNAFSTYLEQQNIPQSNLYINYVHGLYSVLERVRTKYPTVPIMLCSGGGSRVDYGSLQYFTEFWTSDNTSPIDRVFMHWDYSHFYPAKVLCAHVTNWEKTTSIKYRVDVASMGKLGFDIVVGDLSEADQNLCALAVKNYQSYCDILWQGDLYRLRNPHETPVGSFQFVNKSQERSVIFSYLISNRFDTHYSFEPMRLKGLDKEKKYRIKELNLYPDDISPMDETAIYSGDFLMKVGINPDITKDRRSVVLLAEAF